MTGKAMRRKRSWQGRFTSSNNCLTILQWPSLASKTVDWGRWCGSVPILIPLRSKEKLRGLLFEIFSDDDLLVLKVKFFQILRYIGGHNDQTELTEPCYIQTPQQQRSKSETSPQANWRLRPRRFVLAFPLVGIAHAKNAHRTGSRDRFIPWWWHKVGKNWSSW